MVDYGLMGAMGEGLKSFVESYRTERSYQEKKKQEAEERALREKHYDAKTKQELSDREYKQKQDAEEKALKDRAYKFQVLQGGYQETPEGSLIRTPEFEQKSAYERAEKEADRRAKGLQFGAYDPLTKSVPVTAIPGWKDDEKELKREQIKKTQAETGLLHARAATERAPGAADQGKTIPAGEVVKTGGSEAALASLDDVRSLSKGQTWTGPIWGRAGKLAGSLGYGEAADEVNSAQAILKQRAQSIGTYLEGGKLTDADALKYEKMLPTITDSDVVKENKIASLQRMIIQKAGAEKAALGGAGYNISNLPNQSRSVDLPSLAKSPKKGGLIPEAMANTPISAPPGLSFEQFKEWKRTNGQ